MRRGAGLDPSPYCIPLSERHVVRRLYARQQLSPRMMPLKRMSTSPNIEDGGHTYAVLIAHLGEVNTRLLNRPNSFGSAMQKRLSHRRLISTLDATCQSAV